jgi:parallel beta-helix repeat protein
VTIRNSVIGPCGGKAIEVRRSTGVRIEYSELLDSDAGIYALDSSSIVISGNTISNAGRNPVQFDKVTGSGNVVSDNEIHNQEGSSETEDSISIYESSGTESSPLVVEGNLISQGGSSRSGSGILVGDNGGSHVVVRGNTLINPGQVGIGVAGGQNISVVDNLVVSEAFPWSNVGIYVWDQYDTGCEGIEVRGNVVEWYNSTGGVNPFWDAGNCGMVAGWDLNDSSDELGDLLGQDQEPEDGDP